MSRIRNQHCPVARSLDLLGERWTLLIFRDLLGGSMRFQDLMEALEGIAPTTLSARLKRLVEAGLIARRFYSEHPPRAEYLLTEQGRSVAPIVKALNDWGNRNLPPP